MIDPSALPSALLELMDYEQVDIFRLLPDTEAGFTVCLSPAFYAVFTNNYGETYLLTGRTLRQLKDKIAQLANLTSEPDLKLIFDVKLGVELPATYRTPLVCFR